MKDPLFGRSAHTRSPALLLEETSGGRRTVALVRVAGWLGIGVSLGALACGGGEGSGGSEPKGGETSAGGGGGACVSDHLFGLPSEQTGLSASQCSPSCGCGAEAFVPEPWTEARVASLLAWTLETPYEEISTDPYAAPPPQSTPAACAFEVVDLASKTYRLTTFGGVAEAEAAGTIPTHEGACGRCSTLADLAVYASTPDLTAPVRQCGIDTLGDGLEANVTCLEGLGFTRPCAQIWAYNTQHTRSECLSVCTSLLGAPYHEPDGSLNACLQCDEDKSGDVFKAVAGRTRRNTGVPSAMCRPCAEVTRLAHAYPE